MAEFLEPGLGPKWRERPHRSIRTLIGRAVKNFETNADFQIRFHLVAMIFWICNAVVGTVVAVMWPALWVQIGVLYVFLLSIYANWDTDFDAVSAASAFKHAKTAATTLEANGQNEAGPG